MPTISLSDIRKLSIDERIRLVEDIWDSIAAEGHAPPLTAGQRAELDDRLDEAEENPGAGKQWEEVKGRLLGDG